MQTKSWIKGIGIGVVAGSILTAAIIPMDKRKFAHSKTGRALRTVGHIVEGVCETFS